MDGVSANNVRALAVAETDLGRAIGALADRCFGSVRVQVSGRTGVGKSTVRSVLAAHPDLRLDGVDVTEAASIDVPRSPDPVLDGDVVIHVVTSGAQPADLDVVASAREVVAVLAKADTIDHLPVVVDRLSASMGVTVHPLMGTVAASVLRGLPASFDALRPSVAAITGDMLLSPERLLRAKLPTARSARLALVEQIEMGGVRTVVEALAANPSADDATLRLLLTDRSGADAVARAVRRAARNVRIDRQGRLLHRLTELAGEHPEAVELERYLGSDEVVVAIMRSALRALGEKEEPNPTLDTAQHWQTRWRSSREPAQARAALAVARGYLRMRTR
ncbi:hypothetical protein [Rhodococcus sp. P1Y]|uniref:hypothetical protein n=1 Tax=Rhodococcus sp. P1Y TaxID=1302308 RepID=UPI000EB2E74B|nr:hypothetical protein [Rhodococcus sp. P1Y]AYJ47945.1 hypothetical protein D8W71_05865 [Rhodococcus sp. P1Y]